MYTKNIVHRDIIWRFRQEEIDAVDDTWTFFSILSTSFVAPGCRNELGKVEEAKELFCKAKEAPVSPKIPELDDGETNLIMSKSNGLRLRWCLKPVQ